MKSSKDQLGAVRSTLIELHRLLLSELKKEYEAKTGTSLNATSWFQILLGDPLYQWARPLNSLIADVDALSERQTVASLDMAILRHELETFFFKDDEEVISFNSHYRKLLPLNPDLTSAHGQLKLMFLDLPQENLPANTDEIRRGWHQIGASKRKLLN